MSTKTITTVIIFSVIAILIGWDLYMVSNNTVGDTISEIVLEASLHRPIIPFAVGFICGHLFFPMGNPDS